jgi:DHA1 family bicyclomycin/chloramphenicol resistance-like MFS transporter
MAIAGLFFDGTAVPMAMGIALCAVAAFVLTQLTIGRQRPTEVEVAAE